METTEYAVILEKAPNNWAAYSPDVPGCIAVGDSPDETLDNYRSALDFHFRGLLEDGLPIPQPSTLARSVKIAA